MRKVINIHFLGIIIEATNYAQLYPHVTIYMKTKCTICNLLIYNYLITY